MPYINKFQREQIDSRNWSPGTAGELNYKITNILIEYIGLVGGPSYGVFNDVIGALECAKLEMYRRMIAPYEDKKKDENGDVYP